MAKGSFLLVNLNEDQTKHLAQVISNESCRKILDYLTNSSATESDLSKKLNLPLSTVHYNIQALLKAKLVESEEFHYSAKGREVLHYRLANKYIIIAPKSTYGIKEKLKSILPITMFLGVFAYLLQFFSRSTLMASSSLTDTSSITAMQDNAVAQAVPIVADKALKTAPDAIVSGAAETSEAVVQVTTSTTQPIIQAVAAEPLSLAFWFVLGVAAAFLLYLLIDFFLYKRKG